MKKFRCVLVVLGAIALSVVGVVAQQPPPPAVVDGFVPMSEMAAREVLPATPLVFYAYAFAWVALLGYVFSIWRRMTRVEQDLEAIARRLNERGGR